MVNSQIRVPEELWDKLKEISEKEERSINAQLVYILKKYIEEYEKAQDKDWVFFYWKKQYYFLVSFLLFSITSFRAVPNVATPDNSAGTIILVDLPSAKCSRAS